MVRVEVDAVEDRSRAEGGHVVILLRGIEPAAKVARIRLRLVDADDAGADGADVLGRDLAPLAIAATPDGLALTLGPDVTSCAALVAGTAVEVAVPELGARGELLWPAVTPVVRAKRRNIMTRRPHAGAPKDRAAAPTAGTELLAPTGKASGSPVAERPALAPVPPAADGSTMPLVAQSAAMPRSRASASRSVAAERRSHGPAPTEGSPRVGSPVQGSPAVSAAPRRMSAAVAAALAVALLIGGQILAIAALDLSITSRSSAAVSVAMPQMPAMLTTAPVERGVQQRSVFDVIAAGARSPRGMPAEGVSPAKALQLAHARLYGPDASRDPQEAVFWLKRYIAGTAGAEHARIALTQLGSAYAVRVRGQRDLASARVAWELASALGDPVAMCFLGAMHEHGLGVTAAREAATGWYERASAAGGSCATGPHVPGRDLH